MTYEYYYTNEPMSGLSAGVLSLIWFEGLHICLMTIGMGQGSSEANFSYEPTLAISVAKFE